MNLRGFTQLSSAGEMRSSHALQADKARLSRHLQPHMARQFAFAAERGR